MCGVVGFSCPAPTPEHINLLWRIMLESSIRGLHSFGIAYVDHGLVIEKAFRITDLTLPTCEKVIFHNRYATSGDYHNEVNNQPLSDGHRALVFNGVLDMRTKEEMEEAYGIKMKADNDGEILLRTFEEPREMMEYVNRSRVTFAGLVLTPDNRLFAFRNEGRPLWRATFKGATYYASTQDILLRASRDLRPEQIQPNTLHES